MKRNYYLLMLMLLNYIVSYAQSDSEKITKAKLALEQKKDCNNALQTLLEVSEEGQKTKAYILIVAKASEECQLYKQAIEYYIKYHMIVPGQADISEKISYLKKHQVIEENEAEFRLMKEDQEAKVAQDQKQKELETDREATEKNEEHKMTFLWIISTALLVVGLAGMLSK